MLAAEELEALQSRGKLWDAVRAVLLEQRDGEALRRRLREHKPPASFSQERLWLLDRLEPGNGAQTLTVAHRLVGDLNVADLDRSLREVTRRHEVLRTTLKYENGRVLQIVHAPPKESLETLVPSESEFFKEEDIQRLTNEWARAPIDLEHGPLLGVRLARLSAQEYRLVVTVHHAVFDGWSFEVFMREWCAIYGAFCRGEASPLPDPRIQYADFAEWQRERWQGQKLESSLVYWKAQLAGELPILSLPADRPGRPSSMGRPARLLSTVPAELSRDLRLLSDAHGVTLFVTLLAAFQTLLYRYTGEEDITVGSPVASRNRPEVSAIIGLFANTLALRTRLAGHLSVRELLARVRDTVVGAYAHQELPFELLVEAIQPIRQTAHPPLFQVMFAYQNVPRPAWSFSGLRTESWNVDSGAAAVDLILFMEEKAGELSLDLNYDEGLFDAATMTELLSHFLTLLEGFASDPEASLAALPLLTIEDRRRQLVSWNDTATPYPDHSSISELFEAQAARRPEAAAVAWGSDTMTYSELDRRSNQLARRLQMSGVTSQTRVGVRLDRSPSLIVALLAIVKVAGAYVPVSVSAPVNFSSRMLRDTGVALLITAGRIEVGLVGASVVVLRLDEEQKKIESLSSESLGLPVPAEGLAYILFTSGSTGERKGVAVNHRGVVRLVRNTNYVTIAEEDVLLQVAPLSFDLSTFEIWGALLNGATLALGPVGPFSIESVGKAISRHGVSILLITPGVFELFVDLRLDELRPVRQLLVCGDVLSVPHSRRFLDAALDCRLINVYGPTENSGFTSWHRVESADLDTGEPIPIGRPISNTSVHVLDSHLQLLPVGVPGEACIGGDGVARGYDNDPDLTHQRFIPDPFHRKPGARLYRSGDRVRWRRDGTLQFLGRGDGQVKIRGFRIEPGEVEAALRQCSGIKSAAVLVQTDGTSDKSLAAYLVGVSGSQEVDLPARARSFLRSRLPEYLIPAVFVLVETLPLNTNGKVDRRALARLVPPSIRAPAPVAPRDELERGLLGIFESILTARPIGIQDSFFDLGGNSLLAVRVALRIEESFGGEFPLIRLFQAPRVEDIADALRRQAPSTSSGRSATLIELKGGGGQSPFFLVPGGHGGMAEMALYASVLSLVGGERPVYGLLAHGLDGQAPVHRSVEVMARDYLRDIRSVQPVAPYALGGECTGGAVAFEMAQQLAAGGEPVSLLLLLGTWRPSPAGARHYERVERPRLILKDRLKVARAAVTDLRHVARDQLRALKRCTWTDRYPQSKEAVRKLSQVSRAWLEHLRRYETPFPGQSQAAERNYVRVLIRYRPRPYPGKVTLVADEESFAQGLPRDWVSLAGGGLTLYEVPGTHETYLREVGDATIDRLRDILAPVPGSAPESPRSPKVGA